MRRYAAAAITLASVIAPWLVWAPLVSAPAVVVACGAIAIVGACHGFGRLLARLTGRDVEAALAVQWGLAVVIGLGGILLVTGSYDARLVLVAGSVVHTADTLLAFAARRAAWEERLRGDRLFYAALPSILLALLAVVHVLGGAGAIGERPYDDDTNIVAQVARLTSTGALDDAIGYPRVVQLGGRMVIDGLVGAFAEPRAVRMVEGLALVLVLWLACARLRPRDAVSAIWASLVVITGSAFAIAWPDRLPLWVPAGLFAAAMFTLHDTRTGPRSQVPLVLLGAALVVLRLELAPVGLALLAASWWLGRRPLREDLRRVALLVGLFAVVVGVYALARALAWSEVDPAARTLIEPRRGSAGVRLLMSIAIGLAALPALLLPVPRRTDAGAHTLRWLAFAMAAGIGGVSGKITGERLFGVRSLWILAITALVVLVAEVARRRELDRLAFALVMILCLLVYEGRSKPGRTNWSWRYWDLMHDVEYVRHASPAGGDYAQLLATVPAGERVAAWVLRPELLDYARHEIVDLRTPRVGKLRAPQGSDRRLARLLRASRARWLVFEFDDAHAGRKPGAWLHELLCPLGSQAPACTDALERIAQQHPISAEQHGVVLIDLGR